MLFQHSFIILFIILGNGHAQRGPGAISDSVLGSNWPLAEVGDPYVVLWTQNGTGGMQAKRGKWCPRVSPNTVF